ncbi:PQQ-dependent sugar dehydrogenase [Actinomycetospora termitidis]|uniref:PQQ-dependent sugar dehydrogenase n=1 Tax=Actinomycetospora termitidis TaxID=3053470 RepID=A0ABT7M4Y8_9PSEU|nr:PQQ-dependent sugar dehydrogenase [Actinomycetospora sp. Odt1-22]MDL5155745.1 PQQ-dependent sugar dehydrogenase [Actinomycetospora sp. Odt1-22]
MRAAPLLTSVALAAVVLSACSSAPVSPSAATGTSAPSSSAPTAAPATGALRVERIAEGLDKPWDVTWVRDRMLVTQREGSISTIADGQVRPVSAELGDVYARGEGGLMGMAAYPDDSGRFVTCQTHQEGGRPVDVRVVAWQLSADGASATRTKDPLVGGLPLNPSGRHSGCRPTFGPDGALWVGTGDTARATIAQDRTALGGKVLRVDPESGGPAPGNPFASSGSAAERLISGYGHRNVQAVAFQPGTGTGWTVEHGSDVDDEVNVVIPGRNYGWDPARGGETPGGYDESVPMTDLDRYPDAVPAAWSSGDPTIAPSGGDFVSGAAWGDLDGAFAVGVQKDEKLLFMRPGSGADAQRIVSVSTPPELDGEFGRIRGVRTGPDGALYLTTDNGDDDVVLRVSRG